MIVLKAEGVGKVYGGRFGVHHQALDSINLVIEQNEFLGIMGPSGSGKTTLLNILATIDTPSSGHIEFNGVNPKAIKGDALALFRRKNLGFIFQDYNLLDTLTIRDNILLPLVLEGVSVEQMEKRLKSVSGLLNIAHILHKRPNETSGGEQQRAAAARAIIHSPSLILADEPTGNLDSKTARDLMECLSELHQKHKATLLVVTHDPFVASFCRRILFIRDGRLYTEIRRGENQHVFFQQILDTLALIGGVPHEVQSVRA